MNHMDYIIRCPSCRTKNRIPSDKAEITPNCGKCGSSINTEELLIGKPVIVTDENFEKGVIRSQLPVFLDCWAPWCGPCKIIGPVIEELAAEWKGRVRVCKLNVDENPQVASQFQIRSIPTMLIFDNGQLKESLVGALPKRQIVQKMAQYF